MILIDNFNKLIKNRLCKFLNFKGKLHLVKIIIISFSIDLSYPGSENMHLVLMLI